MPKTVGDYSAQELAEIGKKVVQNRQKEAERSKERNKVVSALYQAWKEGKVTVPGIPKPPKE